MGEVGRGRVVLLVEDNAIIAQAITWLLDELGCTVRWAANVEQALQQLDGAEVLLADYRLPDGTGIDLYQQAGGRRPRVAALMSAFLDDHIEERALRLGFDACYDKKEFTIEMLRELVDRAGPGGA